MLDVPWFVEVASVFIVVLVSVVVVKSVKEIIFMFALKLAGLMKQILCHHQYFLFKKPPL